MKFYTKVFKHNFDVKRSSKNVEKTYQMQLAFAEASEADKKDPYSAKKWQRELDLRKKLRDYTIELLHLNGADIKALDNADDDAVVKMETHLQMRMMGYSEEDIKRIGEDTDTKK